VTSELICVFMNWTYGVGLIQITSPTQNMDAFSWSVVFQLLLFSSSFSCVICTHEIDRTLNFLSLSEHLFKLAPGYSDVTIRGALPFIITYPIHP